MNISSTKFFYNFISVAISPDQHCNIFSDPEHSLVGMITIKHAFTICFTTKTHLRCKTAHHAELVGVVWLFLFTKAVLFWAVLMVSLRH